MEFSPVYNDAVDNAPYGNSTLFCSPSSDQEENGVAGPGVDDVATMLDAMTAPGPDDTSSAPTTVYSEIVATNKEKLFDAAFQEFKRCLAQT